MIAENLHYPQVLEITPALPCFHSPGDLDNAWSTCFSDMQFLFLATRYLFLLAGGQRHEVFWHMYHERGWQSYLDLQGPVPNTPIPLQQECTTNPQRRPHFPNRKGS